MFDAAAIQTLAALGERPMQMPAADPAGDIQRFAVPDGWKIEDRDNSKHQPAPRRKVATVAVRDEASFIAYLKRHGSLDIATLWCDANFRDGKVALMSIINDHGGDPDQPQWRDHRAHFAPEFSEEWNRWYSRNAKPFTQVEFASFIEDNIRDIAGGEGSPTGSQMLEMALSFEANQDMRFKSAVRLQNGGVQLQFVSDDDAQTVQKMAMFDRFALGVPIFWSGHGYRIECRLRYRVKEGRVSFWFDMIRPDLALQDATLELVGRIQEATGFPLFHGNPFKG